MLAGEGQEYGVAGLLFAGSYGLGATVDRSNRCCAIGALLAITLGRVADSSIVPTLVAASRYAAGHLDSASDSDPLQDAVRRLLVGLEREIGPGPAARTVVLMFSGAELDDRHTVTSIVLGER